MVLPALFGMEGSLLALVVFAAEMCVVTLATLRIIFIGRGLKVLAASVGFFEINIWLFAIGQVMTNLNDLGCFFGFAAGFTLGNYLGVFIENKLALGTQVVRTITTRDSADLINMLRLAGYGVTRLHAEGTTGPVQVVFTVIQRKQLRQVVGIITQFDPRAFYSVEDVQLAMAGVFPAARTRGLPGLPSVLRLPLRVAWPESFGRLSRGDEVGA
jgi:uncharacterized protein YebE (UPF0316 family)